MIGHFLLEVVNKYAVMRRVQILVVLLLLASGALATIPSGSEIECGQCKPNPPLIPAQRCYCPLNSSICNCDDVYTDIHTCNASCSDVTHVEASDGANVVIQDVSYYALSLGHHLSIPIVPVNGTEAILIRVYDLKTRKQLVSPHMLVVWFANYPSPIDECIKNSQMCFWARIGLSNQTLLNSSCVQTVFTTAPYPSTFNLLLDPSYSGRKLGIIIQQWIGSKDCPCRSHDSILKDVYVTAILETQTRLEGTTTDYILDILLAIGIVFCLILFIILVILIVQFCLSRNRDLVEIDIATMADNTET